MEAGAERDAQVEDQVREQLRPGEAFRAVAWVSRADARTSAGLTRAEMSPFRIRRPAARRRAYRPPRTLATGLEEHVHLVTDPRVLALTDLRLMVLAERVRSWRDLLRPSVDAVSALRLCWECPRADLASTAEQGGRLRLTFTDGSTVTLLTPSARIRPFLAG